MKIRDFIFSEKKSDRIKRHLLFWMFYWVCLTFLHATSPGPKPRIDFFRNLPYSTVYSFSILIPQVFFTYALISFVLPKYLLKSRYAISFLWIIIFAILTAVVNYMMLRFAHPIIARSILPGRFTAGNIGEVGGHFLDFITCFKGTLVAAAAACIIRLVKYWHIKERRTFELLKEKTEAQLQLLRAQIHPHFLFNTLNNIFSKAQNESPASARMIMELSHILRFVLDDGKNALVPLDKEMQMLVDYINLEKVRYRDKLDLHLSLPSNTEEVYIAPLLLLPFVENCFKHGASRMIDNPWITLKIELNETALTMKLLNGKITSKGNGDEVRGTGIENARKRLELLYKGKYVLQINEDDEVFVVDLVLELAKITTATADHRPINSKIEFA